MKGRRTRTAAHETVIGRDLRLLGRAIRWVPGGRVFDSHTREGRYWDHHTHLFLRPRGVSR